MQDYFNQRINCKASTCRYYDAKERKCSLGSITVGKESKDCLNYKKDEL